MRPEGGPASANLLLPAFMTLLKSPRSSLTLRHPGSRRVFNLSFSHSALLEVDVSVLFVNAFRNFSCCLQQAWVRFRFPPLVSRSRKTVELSSLATSSFTVLRFSSCLGCYDFLFFRKLWKHDISQRLRSSLCSIWVTHVSRLCVNRLTWNKGNRSYPGLLKACYGFFSLLTIDLFYCPSYML